jgi:hypothetical protein
MSKSALDQNAATKHFDLPCERGDVVPVFQWPTSIGTIMLIDAVSCETAIPCVDDRTWTKAPDSVSCVDSTVVVWSSYSCSPTAVKATGGNHSFSVSVQRSRSQCVPEGKQTAQAEFDEVPQRLQGLSWDALVEEDHARLGLRLNEACPIITHG